MLQERHAITFSSVMVLFRAKPVRWVDEWLANGADIHAEEMERYRSAAGRMEEKLCRVR